MRIYFYTNLIRIFMILFIFFVKNSIFFKLNENYKKHKYCSSVFGLRFVFVKYPLTMKQKKVNETEKWIFLHKICFRKVQNSICNSIYFKYNHTHRTHQRLLLRTRQSSQSYMPPNVEVHVGMEYFQFLGETKYTK